MIAVCKGCCKAVNEDQTSMCIHCLAEFCDMCVPNCGCQQVLNQIWDSEEVVAARIVALGMN